MTRAVVDSMMMMFRGLLLVAVAALAACATTPDAVPQSPHAAAAAGPVAPLVREPAAAVERIPVRDPEMEHRVARLELQLWERDATIEDLQGRLDDALQEVVRAMAKLQSLATRAEAASAMAEADLALQSTKDPGREAPGSKQAARFMQLSAAEFKRQNYGGALYLANQAKAVATRLPRFAAGERSLQPGETAFAVPVRLRTTGRANLRGGPGVSYAVVAVAESGASLTGLSYLGDWVRVTNDEGREAWIARALLASRAGTGL